MTTITATNQTADYQPRPYSQTLTQSKELYFNLSALLKQWLMHYRTRRQLAAVPDFMLKDLGLSRAEAEHEANKPFWKN